MRNYGNTCYFNSALQCLKRISCVPDDHWELLCRFRTRFSQFTAGPPHDAQEALMCLIDLLDTKDIQGTMLQEVVCRAGTIRTEVLTTVVSVSGETCTTLGECLTKYQTWTQINGYTDTWGTTHNVSAFRTIFWKLPKFFIVSLNQKMFVTVSEILEINGAEYELVASCIHLGNEDGGHYVALIKELTGWFLKDDERNIELEGFPCRHTHYIVFYKLLNSCG